MFADLPQSTLGALVLVSAIGLVTVEPLRQIGRIHRRGACLGVITLVAVLFLGVLEGVLVGVLASMLNLVHALNHPVVERLDSGAIRITGPLYFANVQRVRRQVLELDPDPHAGHVGRARHRRHRGDRSRLLRRAGWSGSTTSRAGCCAASHPRRAKKTCPPRPDDHGMPRPFQGNISLDIRDSTQDWPAFLADSAPENAPNVLVVLYDDTGQAAWSPYGGRIEMPTLDRLAKNGLTYSQWHTTALCSPTRSVFLTGRNHHQNGFATISETSTGFPGYNSHIPPSNATLATVLRNAGWSTFWVGKNHNTAVDAWTMGSSKKAWPLGLGHDRFYGFIGGETNQWYPDLAEDNHYIDQPYLPEDGYHLSADLADKALEFIRDTKQSEPDKPWYMWFCPGANHAPHHCPQDFIDKYKGVFDDGYEAYREWVLPRMIERGILPEGPS